ncbi:outer membrane scaffolding protein for murein synthesis (MipA/OmpV family) [Novosphingobium sp. PhB165]|uniref:MipA/OmpV family protein n=1 Tax=Novosphingobium sp. PhB165 TaxID=2485105 RepID=UPI00104686BC|nr:MipA/OmpV family protein [Novosphingobium sp. PhB165]TCM19809.1 outer membrane scaffolding protein for murein synthesis (MipA/OmpV family) [Novosphingobium sp. PhB165]
MRFPPTALTLGLPFALLATAFPLAPAAAQDAAGTSDVSSDAATASGDSADSTAKPHKDVMKGDYLLIGVGALYGPSYQGSNDQVFSAIPVVMGRFHGVKINPRPRGVSLDLIPDGKDAKFGFELGPVGSISYNRVRHIEDPVVKSLGKLDPAIEFGVNTGVTANRLLNPYDSLTLSTDVMWDVNAYHGMTWSPGITYKTPLSKAVIVALNVRAHHVDDKYARYYFSVTPEQSAKSGLPEFDAKGGWSSVSAGILAGYDLSGDFTDGGFALFAALNYSAMLNDAKRTPFTSLRGSSNQWTLGGGVSYTF